MHRHSDARFRRCVSALILVLSLLLRTNANGADCSLFQLSAVVGSGKYSTVYRATRLDTGMSTMDSPTSSFGPA
eukprot:8354331-Pyramimonas_sp.AAC.1